MSVKGFYKDMLILSTLVGLIISAVYTLYFYFTTNDVKYLYFGLLFTFLATFGALARYRFVIDYI